MTPRDSGDGQPVPSGTHAVAPTPLPDVRRALTAAFEVALATLTLLGEGEAPEETVTTGQVDLPVTDPRRPDDRGVEVSATRTAESVAGRVVLHETRSARASGEEIRTTIALTGVGPADRPVDQQRFWLGATSYADAPVTEVELVGDPPAFAETLLSQALEALLRPGQG